MSSRMDKYKRASDVDTEEKQEVLTRSDKNKKLYTQIYNAYDEFENLIVPSNAKEITISELKREIKMTEDNTEEIESNIESRRDKYEDEQVFDINELINKAVSEKKDEEEEENTISNGSYLKKLKLDSRKTNIEQVKEMYEDINDEENVREKEEDEELLKTANLSLEILSDLKSDNDVTRVSAPIKTEELPEEDSEPTFYSSNYKFSKRDFEKDDEEDEDNDEDEEEDDDDDDEYEEDSNGKFFFKVLLLIFGLIMIVMLIIYIISYFNRV